MQSRQPSRGFYFFVCGFATVSSLYAFYLAKVGFLGWVVVAAGIATLWTVGFLYKGFRKAK
jgi:hypothetical protein